MKEFSCELEKLDYWLKKYSQDGYNKFQISVDGNYADVKCRKKKK